MSLKQRLQDTAWWLGLLRWTLPVVLVVMVAALLADTTWLWLYGPSDTVPRDPELPRLEETESGDRTERIQYQQVRDWALFGTWENQQGGGNGDQPVDAPETRLQLKLLGVFQTGEQGQSAGAIIAEQGDNGKLYRVGDRLPGNARLEQVHADRVILRRQGQLETLKLESPGLEGGVQSVDRSSGRQRSSQREAGPRQGRSQDQGSGPAAVSGDVEEQRQRIIRGLGLESSDQGYVIGESAPAQLLDRAGLKPGDVVVSVNGHNVGQKKADLAALREYHDKGSAKVVIQRGSQRFTVTVPP
jgi:general secretion pathway protein C